MDWTSFLSLTHCETFKTILANTVVIIYAIHSTIQQILHLTSVFKKTFSS